MRMTAADHIAGFLTDRGVELVFGLCGHTNISLLAALERAGAPRFVTTRHEQVAAHAADGYARASGKPGVVLLHVGPGMTNAVTGVATASFDSVPLLVIAGDVPSYYEGRGPHQEVNLRRDADQVSIYEPFVKRAWRVRRADQLPRTMARAWDLAVAGRPGPVLVSIPMDILGEALDAPIWPASPVERPALSTCDRSGDRNRAAHRPATAAAGGRRDTPGHRPGRQTRGDRWPAGGAHAHGHRRAAAGPSTTGRHRRILGVAGREPAGGRGRPDPRRRDTLS